MVFLISEMTKFDIATTKTTEIAITKVGFICVVTANAEQMPNTCMVMGLSSTKGSVTSFFLRFENKGSDTFFSTAFSKVSVLIFLVLR